MVPVKLLLQLFSIGILLAAATEEDQSKNFTLPRNKRQLPLIYERPAAITFITGFGIPVHNLNPELVTVGMVFKAQQFLPTTYASLRHHANHSIHKRQENVDANIKDQVFDKYRLTFYKALEQLSITLGQAGRECVLKMICEVAATPFSYRNGVLGEVMHILLTPSTTFDAKLSQIRYDDYAYFRAEQNGHSTTSCDTYYADCSESILERITNLFE